jgi:putative transposase
MKQEYPQLGIGPLCRLLGKTRHAYYDHQKRLQGHCLRDDIILAKVLEVREELPRIGTLKLHHMLTPVFRSHNMKVGRDYMFDLLGEYGLLVRARRRRPVTTNSRHWMHKYPNLIRGLEPTRPEQLWVSDITYVRLKGQWAYLSLITDGYSKQIMGYALRTDLSAQGCLDALKMAFLRRRFPESPLMHHSDRGSQYCSKEYVELLLNHKVAISMTENGDPLENAVAERINGTIKNEFDRGLPLTGIEETRKRVTKSIEAYNNLRPHLSLDMKTPNEAHQLLGPIKKRWKKKNYSRTKQQLYSNFQINSLPCIVKSVFINQCV